MQIANPQFQGSSSHPENQTPIQVLKANNMNLPISTLNQPSNINESKLSSSSARRRQSIFDPNQQYDKKEVLAQRPVYQQRYSNRKPKESLGSGEGSEQKKSNCCSKPLIFGIIGALVLLGIIALILFLTLKHPKQNNVTSEEDGIEKNKVAIAAEEDKEAATLVTAIEKDIAQARENIVKKNGNTKDTLSNQLKNTEESVNKEEVAEGTASTAGLEDSAAKQEEEKALATEQNKAKSEQTKEGEALKSALNEVEKKAETAVKEGGETVKIGEEKGETSVSE